MLTSGRTGLGLEHLLLRAKQMSEESSQLQDEEEID